MLGLFKNVAFKEARSKVREPAPWRLSLINNSYPVEVFIYFTSHEEARDHEDVCKAKGWVSLGITWYDN